MDTVKEKLAYYAGFMDGEGTITIKRSWRYGKLYYVVLICCAQIDKIPNSNVVMEMKELFGGTVCRWKNNKQQRMDTISWQITSKKAKKFLDQIQPYLKIKNRQAEVAREFIATIPTNFKRTSQEVQNQRAKLFDKMRTYNVKGTLRLQRLNEEAPKKEM